MGKCKLCWMDIWLFKAMSPALVLTVSSQVMFSIVGEVIDGNLIRATAFMPGYQYSREGEKQTINKNITFLTVLKFKPSLQIVLFLFQVHCNKCSFCFLLPRKSRALIVYLDFWVFLVVVALHYSRVQGLTLEWVWGGGKSHVAYDSIFIPWPK